MKLITSLIYEANIDQNDDFELTEEEVSQIEKSISKSFKNITTDNQELLKAIDQEVSNARLSRPEMVEIQIPFNGFYESFHDDAIERAISSSFEDDQGDIEDDIYDVISNADIDYQAIYKEYAEAFTEAFGKEFDLDLKFIELVSPREYNFGTDRIFAKVPKAQIDKIRTEAEASPKYADFIKERYTSYDGFISFFSNDSKNEDWTKPILKEVQYASILDFWIDEKGNSQNMEFEEYSLIEDIDVYNFDSVANALSVIEKDLKK